jgi:DNA-binding CsgD family transcriptional regulator
LALASVRSVSGERRGARAALDEARSILESFGQDTGILSELLERQERRLRAGKPREGQLDGDLTKRELDVLGLLVGEMRVTQTAQSLYVAPSTVRTQINSVCRKPINPLGETTHWVKTHHPAVHYAQRTLESGGKQSTRKGTRAVYRIVVRSELSARYAAAFEGMEMETKGGRTILTGEIIDESHLHGILDHIGALGLKLVSVEDLSES